MKRKKEYRLRFTRLQNHYMRCNAQDLKLDYWTTSFSGSAGFFEQTINLRKLTDEQVRELHQILRQAGGIGKTCLGRRKDRTRKALRRKLGALVEFTNLSVIDRLGELRQ